MILPKVREIKEALVSLFSAPYTTRFPAQPDTESKRYRGMPRYDKQYCVGCGACAQVCPSLAIKMTDDPILRVRTLRVDYGSCIQCGQCEEKCITAKGIANTNFYSPAVGDVEAPEVFETVEKELVLCEGCGEIIACRDHLGWISLRLGAKAYAHPGFLLLTQAEFADVQPPTPKESIRREDQIKTVCAKCRQRIVTADEF
jgi:formate hydrogenlyase subunit 6/NADH:ubiquinone oxidoreductase subunit I